MTVNGSARECRPKNARRVMKYKYALTKSEIAAAPESEYARMAAGRDYLQIVELSAAGCRSRPRRSWAFRVRPRR